MSDDLYYIWLSEACGAGSALPQKLLGIFKNAENIYLAKKDEFKEKCDFEMDEGIFEKLCAKELGNAEKALEFCAKNNVSVLNCDDALYPGRLRGIRAFPAVLYYRGRLPDIDDNLCVAMVGTRKMTEYGKSAAYELAKELASCGAIIISGMAEGIDTASHRGCLAAGGFTVAVFGCGIDKPYPPENRELMGKIVENGLIMTEYPPKTEPKGFHFPMRNRIISGLSQAVLVVEADNKSGALITAKTALFQGRELYAVPGNINAPNSRGANNLLKEQAGIVTEAYDILSEYEHLYSHRIDIEKTKYYNNKLNYSREQPKEKKSGGKNTVDKLADGIKRAANFSGAGMPPPIESEGAPAKKEGTPKAGLSEKLSALKIILSEPELKVFEIFHEKKEKKLRADDIATDMQISEVMNTLTFLELYGIITSCPGDCYKISDSFTNL
ncbi:MAG: DNA-processing protein DprA [Oscillospiraceae bacterium]|nr:DNA-processing protein DprA [Oscillospiraceae bacterium]